MKLSEIIKAVIKNNSNEISINYICGTTPVNSEYIDIKIGSILYSRVNGENLAPFIAELNTAIDSLKPEFPNLHFITKKVELHFYYSGFNSCSTRMAPVSISNIDPKSEIQKTGIVKENYQMIGKSKVLKIINSHPGYELYTRTGFSFRGAQERPCSLQEMTKILEGMACFDVQVIDNEIHVNGFSYSDMD